MLQTPQHVKRNSSVTKLSKAHFLATSSVCMVSNMQWYWYMLIGGLLALSFFAYSEFSSVKLSIADQINACAPLNASQTQVVSCLRSSVADLLQTHSTKEIVNAIMN